MNKKVILIICLMIIGAMIFASCSAQSANENTTAPSTEQASDTLTPVDAQVGTEEKPTDTAATETAADQPAGDPADNKEQSEAQKPTEATTKKPEATTKKETTTKKPVTTTKKPTTTKKAATTKKPVTTTKKAATTKKPTTTKKPATTKKHVTPQEVQAEVNAYIKSKGVFFRKDYWSEAGISEMTPDNASWTLDISDEQEFLDSGTTLRHCKEEVDLLVSGFAGANPKDMYCYYDGDYFYILYW